MPIWLPLHATEEDPRRRGSVPEPYITLADIRRLVSAYPEQAPRPIVSLATNPGGEPHWTDRHGDTIAWVERLDLDPAGTLWGYIGGVTRGGLDPLRDAISRGYRYPSIQLVRYRAIMAWHPPILEHVSLLPGGRLPGILGLLDWDSALAIYDAAEARQGVIDDHDQGPPQQAAAAG